MKTKKTNSIQILFLSAVLLLAGCKNSKEQTTTIRFMYWGGTQEIVTKKKMIARFQKENPGVIVESETIDFGRYLDKLLLNYASGSAADVILLPETFVNELTTRGVLADLTPFLVSDENPITEELIASLVSEFQKDSPDGKSYVLPNQFFTGVTYINRDIFDQYGVGLPGDEWTWDDATAMARKMTTMTGEGGKRKIGISSLKLLTLGHNAQEPIYTPDGRRCVVNSPGWISLGKFLVDATDRQKITVNAQDIETQTGYEGFLSGTIAMLFGGQYMAAELALRKQIRWDVVPMPRFKNTGYAVDLGLHGLALSKDTKHPDLAWNFLRFMESQSAQNLVAQLQINLPANNKSLLQAIEKAPAGFERNNLEMAQKSLKYAKRNVVNKRISSSEFTSTMKNFDRAFASGGGVPVEVVLGEIAAEINTILSKGND